MPSGVQGFRDGFARNKSKRGGDDLGDSGIADTRL